MGLGSIRAFLVTKDNVLLSFVILFIKKTYPWGIGVKSKQGYRHIYTIYTMLAHLLLLNFKFLNDTDATSITCELKAICLAEWSTI